MTIASYILILSIKMTGIIIENNSLIVSGTADQWNNVWDVIDASKAPHDKVKEAQTFIFGQLKSQIDTIKK